MRNLGRGSRGAVATSPDRRWRRWQQWLRGEVHSETLLWLDENDVAKPGNGAVTWDAHSPSVTPQGEPDDPERPGGYTHRGIGALVLQRLFDRTPPAMSIGRFTVLERIGRGGMGTVYAAYDERLDRKVAVKVLAHRDRTSETARLRLEREAQAMARLSHPNVVTVHEVGDSDEGLFIAMEFIRGQSLEAWFETEPDWREVVDAFVQAGRGLVAAHEAGLIHRDLKPQNMMRGEDGVVKVLDFGLARAISEPSSTVDGLESDESSPRSGPTDLTRTGALMGTPAFMSPEQHRGLPADARSDQFSFCVALYEGLYRRSPFDGHTLAGLVQAVLSGDLRSPPAEHRVPTWVHRVLLRGLSLEPEQRWPSMEILVHQLQHDPSQTRRRWGMVAGVAGLTVAMSIGLAGLWADGAPACPSAGAAAEALWSEDRQRRIAAAFEGTGSPLASETITRLGSTIDSYVGALGTMRAEACRTHRSGEHSEGLFDLRAACLDVRQAGLDQLLTEFEQADAATVENAAWAAASLRSIDPCANTEALTAAVPPPEDPQVARQVRAQREVLASAEAQVYAGAYEQARERLDAVLGESQALGYAPLVAEAQLRRGAALMEMHEHEPARAALSEALTIALRSGHDEVAVEATARRMWILADPLRRPQEALGDDEFADALLDKLDRPVRQRWLLLNNRGVAQFRGGLRGEAERSYREALAALGDEQAYPLEHISTRFNLAVLLSIGLGDPQAAAVELRAAREQAIALLGPDHPRVAVITARLAASLVAMARYEEAQRRLDSGLARWSKGDPLPRALLLLERTNLHLARRDYAAAQRDADEVLSMFEAEAIGSVVMSMRGLARVGQGDGEAGLAELRRAITVEVERSGPDHENVANAHWWVGHGLHHLGRLDEAAASFERFEAIITDLGLDGVPYLGRAFGMQVTVELERGAVDRAERRLDAAVAAQDEAGFSDDNVYRALAELLRGELRRARDDRAGARAAYDVACTSLSASMGPLSPELAACRLGYARALGPGDAARALVRQARSTYDALGPGFSAERAEVDALTTAWDEGSTESP